MEPAACSRYSSVVGVSGAVLISTLLRGKRRGMARGKTWHGANERRRLQRLEAGKTPRTRDGKGRARGRAAWNLRRALARARARLQRWLSAQFGLKPLRRLRGKQPRHALNMASMKVLAKREEASMKVLDSPNKAIAIGWPSDVAMASSTCAPDSALPSPPSEHEPLDDAMLHILEEHLRQCAGAEQQRRCQQSFRFLARCAGARVD